MSPLPTRMINRWQNRQEPGPGQGTLYWHILVGNHPEARDLAHTAQKRLAGFHGLHMTPTEWLHITTLVVGPTDEITLDQRQEMLAAASELLAALPPVPVTLSRILYHPEAIAVAVEPTDPLRHIRNAVQMAMHKATGREGLTEGPAQWTPHMTLAYSETEQPAGPLITTLGRDFPTQEFAIKEVTLVDQRGSERLWNWQPVGRVPLLGR
ncbi:2'-5' RNA ligase family protein [Actinomadura sp. NPDC023710]|uniref:2'-5' RNA ligase family protein n=1 Tax=Actinomadura sp. NPDC023710 TaxID=3158219 RepID=UPI0033CAE67D